MLESLSECEGALREGTRYFARKGLVRIHTRTTVAEMNKYLAQTPAQVGSGYPFWIPLPLLSDACRHALQCSIEYPEVGVIVVVAVVVVEVVVVAVVVVVVAVVVVVVVV